MVVSSKSQGVADILAHFYRICTETTHGRLLLSIWGSFFGVVGLLALMPKKKRPTTPKKRLGRKATSADAAFSSMLRTLRARLGGPLGGVMLAYASSLSIRIFITSRIAKIGGNLGSYFGAREWSSMFNNQVVFGLWCMLAAATTAAMKFLEKRVALAIHGILYGELRDRCFGGAGAAASRGSALPVEQAGVRMYRVGTELEDTPARLTTELRALSTDTAKSFGHILKPVVDIVYLTIDLSNSMGFWPLVAFNAFFVGADRVLRIIGGALPTSRKELAAEEGRLNARLRAHHQRAHDFREEIAMQSGVRLEDAACAAAFGATQKHRLKTMWLEALLDVCKAYVIKYGGMMCAFSVLIPTVYTTPVGAQKLGTPQQVRCVGRSCCALRRLQLQLRGSPPYLSLAAHTPSPPLSTHAAGQFPQSPPSLLQLSMLHSGSQTPSPIFWG